MPIPESFSLKHTNTLIWYEFFRKFFDCENTPLGLSAFRFRALMELFESNFGADAASNLKDSFVEQDGLVFPKKDIAVTHNFLDAIK